MRARGMRNSGVRQCLGFCTADFWSSLAYESAEQKTKNCLNQGFLIPLMRDQQANLTGAPHVDVGRVVCGSEDELGGAVVPRTDVGDVGLSADEVLRAAEIAELQNSRLCKVRNSNSLTFVKICTGWPIWSRTTSCWFEKRVVFYYKEFLLWRNF